MNNNKKPIGRPIDPDSKNQQRKRKREIKKNNNEENIDTNNDNDENINKISILERNKLERKKIMDLCMKKENMDVEAKSTLYHHMQWNWDACDEIIVDTYELCYKKLTRIRKFTLKKIMKLKWPVVLIIWNIEHKRRLPRDKLLHRDHFHIHAFLLFMDFFENCAEKWRWDVSAFFEEYNMLEPDNISFHNREHGIHYCATYVTKYTWLHEPIVDKIKKDFDYSTFINEQIDLEFGANIGSIK